MWSFDVEAVLDGCLDVRLVDGASGGTDVNSSPHCHVTAYEPETGKSGCGHLEAGSIVHTLGEIVARMIDDPELTPEPSDHNI